MKEIALSALDLAVINEGGNASEAIARTVKVAQQIEMLGYKRIWLAEHHNMENIASSATSVLIGHVAGKTKSIRVGSGGIMLPNHAPLAIAEQFGTLATLYPGRIDLGLGRAPGTDQATANALRRNDVQAAYNFPSSVIELHRYLGDDNYDARVRAFPGEGTHVPLWILGSSTDSAYLAAQLGLPYAFAAHFAPNQLKQAIKIYSEQFQASEYLAKPYVITCANVIAAESDEKANYLATSLFQMFLGIVTNSRKPLQPPVQSMANLWNFAERAAVLEMTKCTFVGSPKQLREDLNKFIEETQIDELMVNSPIFDLQDRLNSYAMLKDAFQQKTPI